MKFTKHDLEVLNAIHMYRYGVPFAKYTRQAQYDSQPTVISIANQYTGKKLRELKDMSQGKFQNTDVQQYPFMDEDAVKRQISEHQDEVDSAQAKEYNPKGKNGLIQSGVRGSIPSMAGHVHTPNVRNAFDLSTYGVKNNPLNGNEQNVVQQIDDKTHFIPGGKTAQQLAAGHLKDAYTNVRRQVRRARGDTRPVVDIRN